MIKKNVIPAEYKTIEVSPEKITYTMEFTREEMFALRGLGFSADLHARNAVERVTKWDNPCDGPRVETPYRDVLYRFWDETLEMCYELSGTIGK